MVADVNRTLILLVLQDVVEASVNGTTQRACVRWDGSGEPAWAPMTLGTGQLSA
jgi:hypothetical protein